MRLKLKRHADMDLREYTRNVYPRFSTACKKTTKDNLYGVNSFLDWLGNELTVCEVTPEILREFCEATGNARAERQVRQVLRTFDPIGFPSRSTGKPKEWERGNGSEFLLVNVYLQHYEPLALRSRRPNTKRLYKTTLHTFNKFLGRPATLDDLTDATVSKFATWRVQSVSKHTVNKDLFNLLALWRWCNRKGLVETWPDVQLEQAPRRVPEAWTESQMRTIYKAVCGLKGMVGEWPACDWWTALILVLWDSGERINAIMGVTWGRVDLDAGWIRFPAEHRKGGREDSAVRLSPEAVSALEKIRAGRGPVFPWPYTYTYLWREYGEILERAGLPNDSRCKFHRIRRSVASHAEAAGGNATAMLRHTKREVTESYLDPTIVKPQQPADVLFRLA